MLVLHASVQLVEQGIRSSPTNIVSQPSWSQMSGLQTSGSKTSWSQMSGNRIISGIHQKNIYLLHQMSVFFSTEVKKKGEKKRKKTKKVF